MVPSYTVEADPVRHLLTITLAGFFAPEQVAALAEDKRAAYRELRCAPNMHVTLVDVGACKIQPQNVVGTFGRLVSDPRYRARRLAFVTGSSLAKMQVRRIVAGLGNVRCFDDRAAAERWLFAAEADAA